MEQNTNQSEVQANCENLAITFTPSQKWKEPFDAAHALKAGTIFPDLYKPFFMGGDDNAR